MNQSPAFLIYASDLLTATNSWTPAELGIYLRLLLTSWVNGPLPSDVRKLSRICGIPTGTFKKMWDRTVSWKFENNGNGELRNQWLEEVREKQAKFRELQREKGIKGAEKRWEKDGRGYA